jgi:hypothetical protein
LEIFLRIFFMYKVRILQSQRTAVIIDGKIVVKDCEPNEDVFLAEIFKEEVESGLYRPYKKQIVTSSGVPARTRIRKRPDEQHQEEAKGPSNGDGMQQKMIVAVDGLQKAIEGAVAVLSEIRGAPPVPTKEEAPVPVNEPQKEENEASVEESGISQDLFIEEGEEIIAPHTREDYVSNANRVKSVVIANMQEAASGDDRDVIKATFSKPKLPAFAEVNRGKIDVKGELSIEAQNSVKGTDLFDMNPVITPINVTKDKQGEVDVEQTLRGMGVQIVGR